ncbi:MAG: DinB family protein [Acidobacteriota bacterium]|nr:DinB family protein [Acidobacteriota bacterium]
MISTAFTLPVFLTRLLKISLVLCLLTTALSPLSHAQQLNTESADAVKAAFLADIEVMREKFIGLAEAFPQDTYTWRPMEGVRSVSEVLMLIASEGYGFAPTALGGSAAMSREDSQGLAEITDKAQVIDHLNKGFDHARTEIEAIDPATLVSARALFGRERSTPELALFVAGDMHEHLGQLIAYARTNQIVPPWSR